MTGGLFCGCDLVRVGPIEGEGHCFAECQARNRVLPHQRFLLKFFFLFVEPAAAAEKDGTFDFGMIVIEEFSPAEDNRAEAVEGPDSEILRRELPAKGLARQKICHHFHCPLVSVRDGNSRCGNGFPFFFQVEMEQDEIGFMPDRLAAQ